MVGASENIKKLEKMAQEGKIKKDILFKRFMNASKVANAINAGKYNEEESIRELEKMMKSVYKNYDENDIANQFLTDIDVNILTMLGLLCFKQKNYERGKNIFYALKNNTEKILDKAIRGKRYPFIIYNLSNELIALDEFDEIVNLCKQGREVCIKTGSLKHLPNIAVSQATAYFNLENRDDGNRLLLDAYFTLRLYDKHKELKKIKDYAKRNFKIDLDKMMKIEEIRI